MKHSLSCLFLSALLSIALPAPATDPYPQYEVVIYKSARVLQLWQGGEMIRRYIASTGEGGKGHKQQQGDKKTPIGRYAVVDIRTSDRYHIFLHLNYPNLPDAVNAYDNGRLDGVAYQKFREAHARGAVPPQNTGLGGQIGIHGLGREDRSMHRIHSQFNWTRGCVALTDRQIEQLQDYVMVGTPVTIYE